MTVEEACAKSKELNATGKHRDEWGYYPAWHERKGEWFVMRRRKLAEVSIAVFIDGTMSFNEHVE